MFVSVNIRVITDNTGAHMYVPGLLTPDGPLHTLIDYFVERKCSTSLMIKIRWSVKLFLEYMLAHPNEKDSAQLFSNFASRIESGTFGDGVDRSGLAWPGRSTKSAQEIITNLSLFFEWRIANSPALKRINPTEVTNAYDRTWDEAAYLYRRERSLLGHLWKNDGAKGRKTRGSRAIKVEVSDPPAFDDTKFIELLEFGFKVGVKYDYRCILIALLQNRGGVRASEVFHLYIEDVVADPANPKSALVRIHHPEKGYAPASWRDAAGKQRKGNRTSYLAEKFGLLPRTKLLDTEKSGWKGGMHDGKFFKTTHWLPLEAGEMFLAVWKKYLRQVAQVERDHPYAFINLEDGTVGAPYKQRQYEKAHARACKRIGLEVKKDLGTTTQGHRHAYGRRLVKGGVSKDFIRKFLHHSSIESQAVYTTPSPAEVKDALKNADEKLKLAYPFDSHSSELFRD